MMDKIKELRQELQEFINDIDRIYQPNKNYKFLKEKRKLVDKVYLTKILAVHSQKLSEIINDLGDKGGGG
jgi:predicted RecB family nuclease